MDIGVQYISSLVSNETIEEVEKIAGENNLEIKTRDLSTQIFASAEMAQFFILIPPALLQAISHGLVSSATYDAIKLIAKRLADQVSGKKYARVRSKEVENMSAKLYLKTQSSSLEFELPANNEETIEIAIKELVKAHVKTAKKDS